MEPRIIHTGDTFFVSCAWLYLNGGLGEGTAKCAGSSMIGSSNLAQSTTQEIGTSDGGFKTTYWRLSNGYKSFP
ncbi:hypothetical protein OkiPb00201_44060 [Escherichia coli]|nr:hypothetical protein VEE15_02410 [Escherichia coli]